MIFTDEIANEMLKNIEAAAADKTEKVEFDHSQFSVIDDAVSHISNADIKLTNNIIFASVDTDDKELLKEKKRSIEVGDITEQAHPNRINIGDGPHSSGVVDNANDAQQKMLGTIYRTLNGFAFNDLTFASTVNELVKMAEDLDYRGLTKEAKQIDEVLRSFLAFGSNGLPALKADLVEPNDIIDKDDVLAPKPVEFSNAVGFPKPQKKTKDIGDYVKPTVKKPEATIAPVAVDTSVSNKAIPAGTPGKNEDSPTTRIEGLNKADKTKKIQVEEINRTPYNGPEKITPGFSPSVKPVAPGNEMVVHPAFAPGAKAIEVAEEAAEAIVKKPSAISKFFGKIKGGGVLGTAVALVAPLLLGYIASEGPELVSKLIGTSTDPQLSSFLKTVGQDQENLKGFIESKNADPTILVALVEKLNASIDAALLKAIDVKDEAQIKALTEMKQTVLANQEQAAEHADNPTTQADTASRVAGIQRFFKQEINKDFKINGMLDQATRDAVYNFVKDMKDDLDIAPKMLNPETLIQRGDRRLFTDLWDIWRRPHLYAKSPN